MELEKTDGTCGLPKETCQFLREVTRDEESPTKRVNEVQVGGVAFGAWAEQGPSYPYPDS